MTGDRNWRGARLLAALIVWAMAWFAAAILVLAGTGGGTRGSLLLGASASCMIGGFLALVGGAILAFSPAATRPRSIWLFRLAAIALLVAAALTLVVALSFHGRPAYAEFLATALFLGLLALAAPWWPPRGRPGPPGSAAHEG